MDYAKLLDEVVVISKSAGQAILDVYQDDNFGVRVKSDDSPLTEADLASHNVIESALKKLTPEIPVLSEESTDISFAERQKWERFWLVDPLDGTKEFIARNDDFTTNIALVENGRSVLSVIYVPVFDVFYMAAKGLGAYKIEQGEKQRIQVRTVPLVNDEKHYTIVASRRHGLDKVEALCQKLPHYDLSSRGSSLKMCMVAEGLADCYPRLAPTSEWDTAAAHCIVEEAGGQLVRTDFEELRYNTKESLLNPHFLVLGDGNEDWRSLLSL
ncbi:3'(2'),5'-bisphosphate nucleotidase CysQ [Pleionea sp. CnH1-48]|uniref:3'(2'),5'-bisphosphate nucleotidase CysQ n=1 Tax=Pleionea sp. CnH1-48 TaxID=2954494 RepID=UPI0020972E65|nr:3'(2'),5'-bisphosphate nucleotidase CysQ [Pleionea sp. CnH1-48]MCO7225191.1 3'(2'),5'-bisphosphate nucleotidase CysQ [Pleionea sp. CnH1-48]